MLVAMALALVAAWALTSTALVGLIIRAVYHHPRCECGAVYLAARTGSVYQDAGRVVIYHALEVCEAVEV